jgi:two-component sensor histidine kinase
MPPDDLSDANGEAIRRHEVVKDLTIIQAQAQMLLRRLEAQSYLQHDEADQRLRSIVNAVQRLAQIHR